MSESDSSSLHEKAEDSSSSGSSRSKSGGRRKRSESNKSDRKEKLKNHSKSPEKGTFEVKIRNLSKNVQKEHLIEIFSH